MQRRVTAKPGQAPANYEAALVQCAAGREEAVGTIYRAERHRLREVAHRIVRNRDYADDVVHDAFLQIIRDAGSFDPARGSARAWIYAIVRNTALKRLRKTSREIPLADDSLLAIRDRAQVIAEPGTEPAEYADLRNCLESLDPRRRASLILAIIDGRTHAEIADYLGVPIGTVKSWIRRELITLRAQLK